MSCVFFEIVFKCNSQTSCVECKYKGNDCHKFSECYNGAIPGELWRNVTSVYDILTGFDKWGE